MWQNSCYRSCAHGQSLLCLQLRVDQKMTLYPRLCVKTANNSDKSYCNRMRSILIWYQKNWERSEFNGRPFVSKLWHDMRGGFLPRMCRYFIPRSADSSTSMRNRWQSSDRANRLARCWYIIDSNSHLLNKVCSCITRPSRTRILAIFPVSPRSKEPSNPRTESIVA